MTTRALLRRPGCTSCTTLPSSDADAASKPVLDTLPGNGLGIELYVTGGYDAAPAFVVARPANNPTPITRVANARARRGLKIMWCPPPWLSPQLAEAGT